MADRRTPVPISSDDIEALQRRLDELDRRCARLQDFADLASDWMWEVDAEYRFTLNDASVERTGLIGRDLIGTKRWDIEGCEPLEGSWEDHIADLDQRREIRNFRYRYKDPSGKVYYASLNARPVFNSDGVFSGYRGTGKNISGQIEAREELRHSRHLLQAIIDCIPVGISIKDAEGRFVLANQSYNRRHGIADMRVEGRRLHDVMSSDLAAIMIQADKKVIESRKPLPFFRYDLPSGDRTVNMLVSKVPLLDEHGRVEYVVSAGVDITELTMHAEETLRASERRFRNLIEGSIQGVVIHRNFMPLFVNRAFCNIFGYSSSEMFSLESLLELFPPDQRAEIERNDRRDQARDDMAPLSEVQGLRKDGQRIWLRNEERAVEWEGGEAVQCVMVDVTERRHAEEQLLQSQKMEAIGQLTGGVAHDFNNLLAVIMGNLELIMESLGSNSSAKVHAMRAINASERGAKLTQQLLTFSRRQALVPQALDLRRLVTDMTLIFSRTLGENVTIDVSEGEDLWRCEADASQLATALLNLVLNARDAMPNGGKLTIETGNAQLDHNDCIGDPDLSPGDYVRLAVTDNGQGMDEDTRRHIFEPFFTTKGPGRGTGLGLSMVYGLVKQLGGQIEVRSEIGMGSTVELFLPRHHSADARQRGTAKRRAGGR
jgi:PAS domain S-box-containing protein